jgi:hypothetical protein
LAPNARGGVPFASFIGILGTGAFAKNFLKSDLDFFGSMGLVLMRGKISVSEGIKVDDIGKKSPINRGAIGFGEDLVADTEATEPEIEEFSVENFFFGDIIMRLLVFFKFGIKCPYLIGKLLNKLYFFFEFFVGQLIFKQFKD